MLYTRHLWSKLPTHRDTTKSPRITREVGTWLYNKDTMDEFQKWCRQNSVRAYGNIKITTTPHFARCLRLTKPVGPGQAIITCPLSATFNFLTVAREMFDSPSQAFPLQINWLNYLNHVACLPSCCNHEMATAGWMVRIASLEDSSFSPYIKYLLEDTRGRDGVSSGMSKEREEDSSVLDAFLSEMATEACEDPEVFLENMFRAFACVYGRTQPIEREAILPFLPGTNFFKAKVGEMNVPTLIPLVDSVPQVLDESHNSLVEFFPFLDEGRLVEQCRELGLPTSKRAPEMQQVMVPGPDGQMVRVEMDHGLMDVETVKQSGGFFALRAVKEMDVGDVLYLRSYPRFSGDSAADRMSGQLNEASRILSHDN